MSDPAGETGGASHAESLLGAFDQLLEGRLPDAALELIVGAESGDVSAARLVAVELRRIHFESGAATAATTSAETLPPGGEGAAGVPHLELTLAALHAAARLRPHARGTLGSWEVTLLRSYLS